jgi:hypothetical protein
MVTNTVVMTTTMWETGEVEGEEEDASLPRFLQSEVKSGGQLEVVDDERPARPQAEEPLRLTLSRNGQRKMVVLSPRNMDALAKLVKQKFRCFILSQPGTALKALITTRTG